MPTSSWGRLGGARAACVTAQLRGRIRRTRPRQFSYCALGHELHGRMFLGRTRIRTQSLGRARATRGHDRPRRNVSRGQSHNRRAPRLLTEMCGGGDSHAQNSARGAGSPGGCAGGQHRRRDGGTPLPRVGVAVQDVGNDLDMSRYPVRELSLRQDPLRREQIAGYPPGRFGDRVACFHTISVRHRPGRVGRRRDGAAVVRETPPGQRIRGGSVVVQAVLMVPGVETIGVRTARSRPAPDPAGRPPSRYPRAGRWRLRVGSLRRQRPPPEHRLPTLRLQIPGAPPTLCLSQLQLAADIGTSFRQLHAQHGCIA